MADDAGYATAAAAFDPIGQQSAAADYMRRLQVQRATMQAGQAVAQGDYAGGAAAIAPYDLAQGQALQQGAQMQTGLTAASNGDLAGARAAGAATGNAADYDATTKAATDNLSQRAEFLARAVSTIRSIPQPDDQIAADAAGDPNTARGQAVAHLINSGALHMMPGSDPSRITALLTQPRDNQTLDAMLKQLTPLFTGDVTGNGGVQTHYTNGQADATGYKAPITLSQGQGLRDDQGNQLGATQPFEGEARHYDA